MQFISDVEVDLRNEDLLLTYPYVQLLKETIKKSPDAFTFTIGLTGEWGSGKSSILKTLISEKDNASHFVTYDAWKYSNDSFRRTFLETIKEEFGIKRSDYFQHFYQTHQKDVKIKQVPANLYLLVAIAALLCGYWFTPVSYMPKDVFTIPVALSVMALLFNILSKSLLDLKQSVTTPYLFATEQFEQCFLDLLKKAREQSVVGNKKIVIIIDNLDRCHKELAYELLTVIKTFLGNYSRIVFIIPFDEYALYRHFSKGDAAKTEEAREFLRKLFSVLIRIKPLKKYDLFDYTQQLVAANKLPFHATTIDIISKEYATNPRRIIQFCNNLSTELNLFTLRYPKSDFASAYESLICKALLIREEWPSYYTKLCRNPTLLNKLDDLIDPTSRDEQDIALRQFLNATDSIGKEAFLIWKKILANSDRNSALPDELEEAVLTRDPNIIVTAAENTSTSYINLYRALIEKLQIEMQRNTYETGVKNMLELLFNLNRINPLEASQHLQIKNEIEGHIKQVIEPINDIDSLCNYAYHVKQHHLHYLDQYIYQQLELNLDSTEQNTARTRKMFDSYVDYNSETAYHQIKSLFKNDYNKNTNTSIKQLYNSKTLQVFCTSDFLREQIKYLKKTGPNKFNLEKLFCLFEIINIDISHFTSVLELLKHQSSDINHQAFLLLKLLNLENYVKHINEANKYKIKDCALHILSAGIVNSKKNWAGFNPAFIELAFTTYTITKEFPLLSILSDFLAEHSEYSEVIVKESLSTTIKTKTEVHDFYKMLRRKDIFTRDNNWHNAIKNLIPTKEKEEFCLSAENIYTIIVDILTDEKKNPNAQDDLFIYLLLDDRTQTTTISTINKYLENHLTSMKPELIKHILSGNKNNSEPLGFCFKKIGISGTAEQSQELLQFIKTETLPNNISLLLTQLSYLNNAPIEDLYSMKHYISSSQANSLTIDISHYIIDELIKHMKNPSTTNRLVILSAVLKGKHTDTDLTRTLTNKMNNNQLPESRVYDFLNPGSAKQEDYTELSIQYTYNGYLQKKIFYSEDLIELP